MDGWQYGGNLMGLSAFITGEENLSSGTEYKWKANAEIRQIADGKVVGRGSAICSSKEIKAGKQVRFDEYAVLSMSQTRAIGKAYRNLIGWVMKLGGYESAPAEEMVRGGDVNIQVEIPGSEERGIQPETQQILDLLEGFKFKTMAQKIAAVNRLTKLGIKDFKLTSKEARTILAALLQKKNEKK